MMLEKALALARQGFPVFPLFPGQKNPALPNWQVLATTDEARIMDWWSGTRQVTNKREKSWIISQNANIGIHTTGLCVLDVDVKDGTTTGLESLKSLPPNKTLIAKTPTNGLHLLFRMPGTSQVGNRANWLPNIDIRGDKGYIVAPGSTINGTAYHWVNPGAPIAMVPPDIMVSVGLKAGPQQVENDFGAMSPDFSNIPDTIPAGGRDDAIFKHCCSMRARNMPREDALVRLQQLFNVVEQPDGDLFTWAEALAKLDQAWSLPAGTPADQVAAQVLPDLVAPVDTQMTLSKMLLQHVFIRNGSLVGDLNTRAVIKLSDFKNAMKPYKERNADDRLIETSTTWLASSSRQEVFDTEYYPDPCKIIITRDHQKFFNTYQPPNLPVIDCETAIIQPFLDHLHYLLPDPMHYNLFLNWAAFTVQVPQERIPWCFLIISSFRGVGKQPIFDMMAKVVGVQNAIQVTKQALSDSNSFNDFMSEKKIVGFDEVHLQGMDFDKLKYLITAPIVEINHKYGAKRPENVFANFLMFTNHADALRIERGDRRFFITHCRSKFKSDPQYYANLFNLIHKTNAPAHFLSFLKARDISGFNHGATPPMTEAKQHMYDVTVETLQTDIQDMIADKLGPCAFDVVSAKLIHDYLDAGGNYARGISQRAVANYLAEAAPPEVSLTRPQYRVPDIGNKRIVRVRCVVVRNAEKWKNAPAAAIALEYVRAREAVADSKTRDQIIEEVGRTYNMEAL